MHFNGKTNVKRTPLNSTDLLSREKKTNQILPNEMRHTLQLQNPRSFCNRLHSNIDIKIISTFGDHLERNAHVSQYSFISVSFLSVWIFLIWCEKLTSQGT